MKIPVPAQSENLPEIAVAKDPEQIERCCAVMRELRPQVAAAEFTARVQAQEREGYRLIYLSLGNEVRAVAGVRIFGLLFSGRTLYIDDLVTRETDRSKGYGDALFKWVIEYAKSEGCETLSLDSGVQRFAAHRFYLNHGLDITAHHFVMKLDA